MPGENELAPILVQGTGQMPSNVDLESQCQLRTRCSLVLYLLELPASLILSHGEITIARMLSRSATQKAFLPQVRVSL